MENYYEILGLSRKPGKDELVFGYLKLACAHHPLHETATADTNERFRLIGEAFCVLYDTKMRFGYDKHLNADPPNELARRVPVSSAQSESLFIEMVDKYAESRLSDEDDPRKLILGLQILMKCPNPIAEASVMRADAKLRGEIRWAAWKLIGFGSVFFVPTFFITLLAMANPNSGIAVHWWGPMLFGAAYMIYGAACLLRGRRPARVNPIEFFLGVDQRP